MKKSERTTAILNELQKNRSVNVKDLSEQFGISEMTIRRDLNELAEMYNITRTHGGAVVNHSSVVMTTSFDEQRISCPDEKMRIAAKAAELVSNGQRIYIDAGSTARALVRYFNNDMHNIIVTNNLNVAEEALLYNNLSVVMLGGEIIPMKKCTSGTTVEEQLKSYRLDIAFLGAAAVGTDGCLYDEYTPDALFKKLLFSVAEQVILLADSSKMNTYQLSSFGSLNDIDMIITDSNITEEGLNLLKKYNVKILIA